MKQIGHGRRATHWLGGLVLGVLAAGAHAQGLDWDEGLRDDAPERYSVVRGDTLWDIAGRFLHHPWQWLEVWRGNPQIDDPHRIYPGDTLYLDDCGDRPCLGLERGREVVHLSPEVRTVPRREAIAPIPLSSVRLFLRDHRVIDDPASLEALGYVVGGDDGRLISGAGDRFYARGRMPESGRMGLYRRGERYLDPTSGDPLGLELERVGEARWLRQEGDIAVLEATQAYQEIRNGDIVLPREASELATEFQPRAPDRAVEGHILSVPGGVRFIGRGRMVALDRGIRDGLAPGHVLAVEQRGELVDDPRTGEPLRLPGEQAGLVMVVHPFEKMSYGLVMRASHPLEVGDRLSTPGAALHTARR
ncbi:LysM peptidoglycan-binding domain-containing protein [Halomonas borealis]|uniref:LysM peptidoglycan-binding domain-containing protein n=1 Tax=Halomonas borealis TaxID=2508710 RepID=UPI00109FCD07|nr:LysM domain-containing protein [Halomonas borealis]